MGGNSTQRVDVSEGNWCEVPAWISHGQMKAIQRIIRDNRDQDMEVQTKLINLLVSDWSFKDDEGNSIPRTAGGIESLHQTQINEVFEVLTDLIRRATPNS